MALDRCWYPAMVWMGLVLNPVEFGTSSTTVARSDEGNMACKKGNDEP